MYFQDAEWIPAIDLLTKLLQVSDIKSFIKSAF